MAEGISSSSHFYSIWCEKSQFPHRLYAESDSLTLIFVFWLKIWGKKWGKGQLLLYFVAKTFIYASISSHYNVNYVWKQNTLKSPVNRRCEGVFFFSRPLCKIYPPVRTYALLNSSLRNRVLWYPGRKKDCYPSAQVNNYRWCNPCRFYYIFVICSRSYWNGKTFQEKHACEENNNVALLLWNDRKNKEMAKIRR